LRRRSVVIGLLGVAGTGLAVQTLAQEMRQAPLIGMLIGSNPKISSARYFLSGLADLGYVEGRDYRLEVRYAEQDSSRLPTLAKGLVALNPSVIFADDIASAIPASKATRTIPIVCPMLGDPVAAGLAKTLSHPGGNVTGVSSGVHGLLSKQIEIATQLSTEVTTIGVLLQRSYLNWQNQQRESDEAAHKLNVKLIFSDVQTSDDVAPAFDHLAKTGAQIVVITPAPMFVAERRQILLLQQRERLPTLGPFRLFAQDGALASYGISAAANFRRAASFVDRILKGAHAGDLPVEFPTKLELIINLKTAKALGLTVPPAVLAQADEVIE
jgi:putative tryptophan/tyrosine transport system substrate-binding protein